MSNAEATYPKRPKFFANKFVRLLTKAAVAQELGPEACWLLAVVAHQEDSIHYARPVTYYNEQLMPLCGFGGRSRLAAARDKAVKHGWLHYQTGGKGIPGTYWVKIPEQYQDVPDGPCDEGDDSISRPESEQQPERKTNQAPISRPESEQQTENAVPNQDGNRTVTGRQPDGKPAPSIPIPIPTPNLSSATPPVSEDNGEETTPKAPKEFFDRWNRFAKTKGLRTARILSEDRATKIRRRLASPGWFQLFVEGLAKLPVPNTERFTWQPDLDWMIANGVNVAKLAEGKYDGRGQSSLQTAQAPAEPLDDYVN